MEKYIDDEQNDDDEFVNTTNSKTKRRFKARVLRSVWFNKEKETLSELLMLFTPWKNEETDLLGNFASYQDRCMVLSNVIKEQMKQYAVCNEDFNEIQQQINQIADRYDDIAPCTQNTERQHQAEGDQDLHPDFSGNYNLSGDLGIPSVDNSEPLTMNELPDDEYRHMVQTLNKEQK